MWSDVFVRVILMSPVIALQRSLMRKTFKKKEKIQRLIWCDRHCCLCGKACALDIELAHIGKPEDNDIDNAIPVCYECHAKMGMYNELHPKGSKLHPEEIKSRREQIYEKYTRHYVAPIHYEISQTIQVNQASHREHSYPDVGFLVSNKSDHLDARLTIQLNGLLNHRKTDLDIAEPLYRGEKAWNLNPLRGVLGHFVIRKPQLQELRPNDRLEIRVRIIQQDTVGRDHQLLEDGYVYNHTANYWYFEP